MIPSDDITTTAGSAGSQHHSNSNRETDQNQSLKLPPPYCTLDEPPPYSSIFTIESEYSKFLRNSLAQHRTGTGTGTETGPCPGAIDPGKILTVSQTSPFDIYTSSPEARAWPDEPESLVSELESSPGNNFTVNSNSFNSNSNLNSNPVISVVCWNRHKLVVIERRCLGSEFDRLLSVKKNVLMGLVVISCALVLSIIISIIIAVC